MTREEAYMIVTAEMGAHPYSRNAMTDALMKGYELAIEKSYQWLKARNVLTDASLEGYRKVMEE